MTEFDVSVILAVKNEEPFVKDAVVSILRQQGLRLEVIVVDDGSDDATHTIVSSLLEDHPNLRLLRNPKKGKCSAFNHGVAHALGRFVCIFAGDDIMPKGSLAARWNVIKDYPNDVPVVGLCKLVTLSTIKRFDGHLVPRRAGRGALSGVSPLMNSLTRDKIFPVPEDLPNEDTWMELSVTHFPDWRVIHSDIIGCQWRVHEGNSISMLSGFEDYNRRITSRIRAVPMFYERYGRELPTASRKALEGKIACEASRMRGSLFGILASDVGVIDKLRSLSIVNRHFYRVRQRLYGLLSGW